MTKILNTTAGWFETNYGKIIEIVLILLGTFLLSVLTSKFLIKLKKAFKKNTVLWDEVIIQSLEKPLIAIIWLVSGTFMLDELHYQGKGSILASIPLTRNIVIISIVCWIVISVINAFEDNLIERTRKVNFDKSTADIVAKVLKVIILSVTGLFILDSLGFSISGLVALGGIGGAALAFASQSLLSNFFGTIIIYLDKPFTIGEVISIKGEDLKGTIEYIGWRVTKLRTPDKIPVYVQNATFSRSSIINFSRIKNKRINEKIGIANAETSAIRILTKQITELLINRSDTDKDYNIVSVFSEFGQDFTEISFEAVLITVDSNEFLTKRQEIMLDIFDLLTQHNLKILYSNDNKQLLRLT